MWTQVLHFCLQRDQQLDLVDNYKCSRFDVEKFSKKSLLLGGQDAVNCTGISQSSSVSRGPISAIALGRCPLLAPATPPEDNIDSARGSHGACRCPPPGGICLSAHCSAVSALPDLLCDYCLIFILKSKTIPPTFIFFPEIGEGAFTRSLPLAELGQSATSNTDVLTSSWEWYSCLQSKCLCGYIWMCICIYICICIFYGLSISPLEDKWLTVYSEQNHLHYLVKGLILTVRGKQRPFF